MSNQSNSKVVTITPSKAAAMLKLQRLLTDNDASMRNRNIKEDKVKMYARDMKAGQWECNGETIILAANGRILDGQHRLLACIEADTAFRTHLVEGVSHTAMRTIDTGVGRTMGDQLTVAGRANGGRLATALGVIWRWEQTGKRGFDWRARPTRLEMFEMLERHPDVEKYASRCGRLDALMSTGLAAALWYIFAKADSDLADVFFEALISGANMVEDDPVFILRERLLRDRREAAIKRSKLYLTLSYTTELVARAWDATRRGVKISKLQRGPKNVDEDLLTRRVKAGRRVSTPKEEQK